MLSENDSACAGSFLAAAGSYCWRRLRMVSVHGEPSGDIKSGDGALGASLEREKGIRWMPWHQEAMKDVARCEKPRGAASRR